MDLKSWLCEQKISRKAYNAEELLASFLSEMEAGLQRESSSLAMINAYLSVADEIPKERSVAVIDAGGTNLRTCLVRFDADGNPVFSDVVKQSMPGRFEEISSAFFYKVLVDALEPLSDRFDEIGFCFSYPADILPNGDGRLLYWTKEIKIPELVGQCVGSGLQAALKARGISDKKVIMLNDTVATLLAGQAQGEQFNASSFIGFILGTGTNTAYIEKMESGAQILNVESGGFDAFPSGPYDDLLDARSENPGSYRFEKVISGVYMGVLTLELMRAWRKEGGFSAAAAEAIDAMDDLYIVEVDNLAAENGRDIGVLGSDAFNESDRETIRTIFKAIVERAALFTAVNISAAVVRCGEGQDPARPICINIDGSTYYKTLGLEDQVQEHLVQILGERGLHIRCVSVDSAPVTGAAIAGLTAFG